MKLMTAFPERVSTLFQKQETTIMAMEEIRLRAFQPIFFYKRGQEYVMNEVGELQKTKNKSALGNGLIISPSEIEEMISRLCQASPYAYEEELKKGYLTVEGGHRIGIGGEMNPGETGQIQSVKHIAFLNIRIAHEIKTAGERIVPYLYQNGKLQNILIVSPPGYGKTTLLRDLIRRISNGSLYAKGMTVGVVDERGEISGSYQGVPQNDIGIRTDCITACKKSTGMMLLLRSMAPMVIAVDELAGEEDQKAVFSVLGSGCKILASIHGESISEIEKKPWFLPFLREGVFQTIIILRKKEGIFMAKIMEKRSEAWQLLGEFALS